MDEESIEDIEPINTLNNNDNNEVENSDNRETEASRLFSRNQSEGLNPIFFFLFNSSLNSTSTNHLTSSIEYLKEIKEPDKIVEDEEAINSLININEIVRKDRDKISILNVHKFQFILRDLFGHVYKHLDNYVENEKFNIDLENTNANFTTFHLISDMLEMLVVSSKDFVSLFHMIGGSKILLSYFSNKKLINYLIKSFTSSDPFKKERKMNYCKAIASLLNAILYLKVSRIQSFKSLNAVEILTNFSNSLNFENCELIIRSHFVLASLSTRKQISNLENIDFTIVILEKTIQMFAQACQKKTKYNLYQFDLFYENEMISFEVNANYSPNTFLIIILSVTESFLVTDEIKYRIFLTLKNSLLILLIQGDAIEKYFALSLLYSLALDEVLNEKIRQVSNIVLLIDQIISETNDESIQSLALCLKYLLNIKNLLIDYKNKNLTNRSFSSMPQNTNRSVDLNFKINLNETTEKKILISYHDLSELISMRIKVELEYLGYNVELINRKSVTESKLDMEKIIKSIEICDCLIICISSTYEFEKICAFECLYASKLAKVYIPVNIEKNYCPDYWLETILENKKIISVNLSSIKYDINLLNKEINLSIKPNNSNLDYKKNKNSDDDKSKICLIL